MSRRGVRLLGLGAIGALAILPVACGDDDTGGGTGGAGGSRDSGTDGAKDAASDVRVDVRADTGEAGGASGTGGTGGMGGSMDAGKDTVADTVADTGTTPDVADGDGGPTCTNPATAGRGKACLIFTPEVMQIADAGVQLDGQGTLFIHVFGTPTPGDTTMPLAQVVYPPPGDAGLNQTSVYTLPQIDIDNLPLDVDGAPGTVYIRTLFIDNPLWLQTQRGLTYGMFVGGYNLNMGVQPPPPLRAVPLSTTGGTVVRQPLTALRRFTTQIVLGVPDAGSLPGNGQGPLSVGAFTQASPANAAVFGGFQAPCVDVTRGQPIAVAGFFYTVGADRDFWFGAQVDDFNFGTDSPPGSIVSLTAGGEIPAPQRITVTADQYSATIPQVTLTGARPIAPDAGTDNFFCPVGDAGTDAPPDVGSDVAADVASDVTDASPEGSADTGSGDATSDAEGGG